MVGLSICYDVRFPELYRVLAGKGAEVILVPAAFTAHTGAAHWHLMLRARAFADGRPVSDIAKDVVERRLRFPEEDL